MHRINIACHSRKGRSTLLFSLSSLYGSTLHIPSKPSTPSKPTTTTAASPPKIPPTSPPSAPPNSKTSSKASRSTFRTKSSSASKSKTCSTGPTRRTKFGIMRFGRVFCLNRILGVKLGFYVFRFSR